MCQAYKAEANLLRLLELRELQEKARKHVSGESVLTKEELATLAAEKLILSEG